MLDCLIFDFDYVDGRSESNFLKYLLTKVKIPYVRITCILFNKYPLSNHSK